MNQDINVAPESHRDLISIGCTWWLRIACKFHKALIPCSVFIPCTNRHTHIAHHFVRVNCFSCCRLITINSLEIVVGIVCTVCVCARARVICRFICIINRWWCDDNKRTASAPNAHTHTPTHSNHHTSYQNCMVIAHCTACSIHCYRGVGRHRFTIFARIAQCSTMYVHLIPRAINRTRRTTKETLTEMLNTSPLKCWFTCQHCGRQFNFVICSLAYLCSDSSISSIRSLSN